jgi:hypothetical protein
VPDTPKRTHAKVELDDGSMYEAYVDQRDYRRFDLTRARMGWPPASDAPFVLQGFCVASALLRQGDITGTDPVSLMERVVAVTDLGDEPIVPTGAGPGPASSSS